MTHMMRCPDCDLPGGEHTHDCSQAPEMFTLLPRKPLVLGTLWPSDAEIAELMKGRSALHETDDGSANPKKAMGDTKLRLDLLPPAALIEMAKALQYGALYAMKKDGTRGYGECNWRETKIDYKTYLAGLVRHIERCIEREDFDPDSRAHVLGHVMAGCAIVLDAQACGTLVDNRPPKSAPIAKLMSEAVAWVKSWSVPNA